MYEQSIIIDGLQYCKWDRKYFKALQKSGLSAVHVTLAYHESARECISKLALWQRYFADNKDIIFQALNVEHIKKAKEEGRVAIFFGSQNCSIIDDELALIPIMRELGIFIMQLSYNNQSLLATGCYEGKDSGITRFGKEAIWQMNESGMIIDLSHTHEHSSYEAIELSKRPVCISHANSKSFHNCLRNKSDDLLKSLAKNKGLLGLSLYPFHLPAKSACTIDEYCKMVVNMANMLGIDSIAIGSDLCERQPQSVLAWMRSGKWSKEQDFGEGSKDDAAWPKPLPWFSVENGMKTLYKELGKYGFSKEELGKILGLNWLNFLEKSIKKLSL